MISNHLNCELNTYVIEYFSTSSFTSYAFLQQNELSKKYEIKMNFSGEEKPNFAF